MIKRNNEIENKKGVSGVKKLILFLVVAIVL